MDKPIRKGIRDQLEPELRAYLRSGNAYVTAGAAMQKNSMVFFGAIHRPTADFDIIREDYGKVKETHHIRLPSCDFDVDVVGSEFIPSGRFKPLVSETESSSFLLRLKDGARVTIPYSGRLRYESIDTALANKACTITEDLFVRKGEISKDIFDIGSMCSRADISMLDRVKVGINRIREVFYLSSSFLHLYPEKMAKRVWANFSERKIRDAAEKGREVFYSSDANLKELAGSNSSLLPSMLLAAANQQLKERIPFIRSIPEDASKKISRDILCALDRDDRKGLDRIVAVVLENVKGQRDATAAP